MVIWFLVQFEDRRDEYIRANDRDELDDFIERRIQSDRSGLNERPTNVEETSYSRSSMLSEEHSPLHHSEKPWRAIDPLGEQPAQYESRCNTAGHNSLYYGPYPQLNE